MHGREAEREAAGEAGQLGLLLTIVADVLGTLIIHLNQRVGPMRRPIGQAFLLNNREFGERFRAPCERFSLRISFAYP